MTTSVSLKLMLPRWTRRVATEGGRDPLGLSRVAFTITDYLLSGIVTTTDRARYYSFYTWALWHIAQEEQPGNFEAFRDAFRRREATMALATLAMDPSSSPVGVDATRKYFAAGIEAGSFDCNFKVLPSNQLGGYGQYYAGSLYKLRLLEWTEDGIGRVGPGIAVELAESFQAAIENTPYIKKRLFLEAGISKNDLLKSSPALSLDALEENFTSEERKRLTEILFGLREVKQEGAGTRLRGETLTLVLHIISELERTGFKVVAERSEHGFRLDEYLLYPMYYGRLWPIDHKAYSYNVPEGLQLCSSLWRQLCLHQFFCQALEDLLCSVLEASGLETQGLLTNHISQSLIQQDFFSFLRSAVGKAADSPRDLLAALDIIEVPDEAFSLHYQRKLSPVHKLSEAQILYLKKASAAQQAARGVLMLAILYGKWRGIKNDKAFAYVSQSANAELWAGRVIDTMDTWLDPSATWASVLQSLLETFVINQHDRIFYEKGNLRSSWLKRTEGRVFKEQDYEPVWRNSRMFSCVRIMADLKLLSLDDVKAVSITAAGTRLTNKLMGAYE
jgi:hypothetical protein